MMAKHSLLLLLFVGAAWSAKPALLKLALAEGLSRQNAMFFMVCGIGLFAALYLTIAKSWPRLTSGLVILVIVSAVTAQLVPIFIATLVAPQLPIGILALLVCTTPFFCAAMSSLVHLEMPSARMAGAIALAVASAAVLLLPQLALSADQAVWAGILLIVPVSYAANQQLIFRYWPKGLDAWQLAGVETVAASLLLLPYYYFATGLSLIAEPSPGHLIIAAWVLLTLAETVAFFVLIERDGPVFVSLGAIIAVMIAPLWGLVLFGEAVTAGFGGSAVLFAFALVLLVRESRRLERVGAS